MAAQKHEMEVFSLKQRLEQASGYLEEVRERERKAREDEGEAGGVRRTTWTGVKYSRRPCGPEPVL